MVHVLLLSCSRRHVSEQLPTKLKGLWDEVQNYKMPPACSSSAKDSNQQEYIIQFLMGLNDTCAFIKSQILDPYLPKTRFFFSHSRRKSRNVNSVSFLSS